MRPPLKFNKLVESYENTIYENERLIDIFTEAANLCPILSIHRKHVKLNNLGYGAPCLDAMWASLLAEAARQFKKVRMLEIGIFKGQTIALWARIGSELNLPLEIHGITPLKGNPPPKGGRIIRKLCQYLSPKYRRNLKNGGFYPEEDYESIIKNFFSFHKEDFNKVNLHVGYSTDEHIINLLKDKEYEIIFVDGDHSEKVARHDFKTYGAKVVDGGWLIADDAGFDLPRRKESWQGYQETTKALEELKPLGFENILNVWHNRIFQRRKYSL